MLAFHLTFFSVWLLLSGFLCLSLCVAALRRHKGSFSRLFSLGMASIALYSFGYALELGAENIESVKLAFRIEYLGVPFITAIWVMMALSYTQRTVGLRSAALLLLIPFGTFALVQTNDFHHLFYKSISCTHLDGLTTAKLEPGPWYYVHHGFSYVCFAVYCMILFLGLRHAQPIFRVQAFLMSCPSLIPLLCLTLSLLDYTPRGVDLTPFGLTVTGLASSLAVWRYEFLTLIPMARDIVFNSIEEAALIVDGEGKLVDFNHAAGRVFPELRADWIGRPLSSLVELKTSEGRTLPLSLSLSRDDEARDYEFRRYALRGRRCSPGEVILFQDVTERLALERRLFEQATQDELTGLYNRHYLMEQAHMAVQCAGRYARALSVMIADMDDFKRVNDTLGHLAGDRLLQQVAECLRHRLRQTDILGRFGGDEFVIVLPEMCIDEARRTAEQLEAFVARQTGHRMSLGVASLSVDRADFLAILQEADADLYRVKQARGAEEIERVAGFSEDGFAVA